MWWIFGGKFSINFPQENGLQNCHRKLHHILHCKKDNCHLDLILGASSPETSRKVLEGIDETHSKGANLPALKARGSVYVAHFLRTYGTITRHRL